MIQSVLCAETISSVNIDIWRMEVSLPILNIRIFSFGYLQLKYSVKTSMSRITCRRFSLMKIVFKNN